MYIAERRLGPGGASRAADAVALLGLHLMPVDKSAVTQAAAVKSCHRRSYADAFAVALAQSLDAAILTRDSQFRSVEGEGHIEWLA